MLSTGVALGLSLSLSSSAPGSMSGLAGSATNGPAATTPLRMERASTIAVETTIDPTETLNPAPPMSSDASVTAASTSAASVQCTAPTPTARWNRRTDDDQWARGLYPAHERYPEGWLALTFDDGPHPTRTPVVLELLSEHELHATFFLTGFAIRSSTYHLVQQMVEHGHTLANHGWRHDIHMADMVDDTAELEAYIESELMLTQIRVDLAMMAQSADDFAQMDRRVFGRLHRGRSRERQLSAMPKLQQRHRALLQERGFSEEDRPATLKWARPPGGRPYLGRYSARERNTFARVLERLGLSLVMWSGGSGDSDPHLSHRERMDPKRIAKTMRKAASRGGIYVAHDRLAPRGLRSMITTLAHSDASVVSLAQLTRAKQHARGWCTPTDERPPLLALASARDQG